MPFFASEFSQAFTSPRKQFLTLQSDQGSSCVLPSHSVLCLSGTYIVSCFQSHLGSSLTGRWAPWRQGYLFTSVVLALCTVPGTQWMLNKYPFFFCLPPLHHSVPKDPQPRLGQHSKEVRNSLGDRKAWPAMAAACWLWDPDRLCCHPETQLPAL